MAEHTGGFRIGQHHKIKFLQHNFKKIALLAINFVVTGLPDETVEPNLLIWHGIQPLNVMQCRFVMPEGESCNLIKNQINEKGLRHNDDRHIWLH